MGNRIFILTVSWLISSVSMMAQDSNEIPVTTVSNVVKSETEQKLVGFKAAGIDDSPIGEMLQEKVKRIIGRVGCGSEDARYMIVPTLDVEETSTSSGLVRNVAIAKGSLTLNAVSTDNPDMVWHSVTIPLETTLTDIRADPAIEIAKQIKVTDAVYVRFLKVASKKIATYDMEHPQK